MRRFVLGLTSICALAAGCETRGPLREWQPSDHQPPPAVAPEGQGTGQESAGNTNARAVQVLWDSRCASCHGATGRGDGPGRPPIAVLPDFTSPDYPQKRTDAELHDIIAKGRNMMPAFGEDLSELGIEAIIAHVRSLAH